MGESILPPIPERVHGKVALIELNVLATFLPRTVKAAMTTKAINATKRPYSTRVCPSSSSHLLEIFRQTSPQALIDLQEFLFITAKLR
jgi:hypothetical protein